MSEPTKKSVFKKAVPYAKDAMNLPVRSLADALSFYETVMGFRVTSRHEEPYRSAVLEPDEVRIGLAENGGDPAQEGCFFEVDDVENAFADLKSRGFGKEDAGFRFDRHGAASFRVFFVVAPDGLCYCLGQRI